MTPVIGYRAARSAGLRHGAALLRWNSSVVDVSPPLKFEPPAAPPQPSQREQVHAEARKRVFQDAVAANTVRHNWTKEEISAIYYQPLLELAFQAVSGLAHGPEHTPPPPDHDI